MRYIVVHFDIEKYSDVMTKQELRHYAYKYAQYEGKASITIGPFHDEAEEHMFKQMFDGYRCVLVN